MKYVGVKQVMKAVENGEVSTVYVGDDADIEIITPLLEICADKQVEVKHVDTMDALGQLAKIDVKAAAAAE